MKLVSAVHYPQDPKIEEFEANRTLLPSEAYPTVEQPIGPFGSKPALEPEQSVDDLPFHGGIEPTIEETPNFPTNQQVNREKELKEREEQAEVSQHGKMEIHTDENGRVGAVAAPKKGTPLYPNHTETGVDYIPFEKITQLGQREAQHCKSIVGMLTMFAGQKGVELKQKMEDLQLSTIYESVEDLSAHAPSCDIARLLYSLTE